MQRKNLLVATSSFPCRPGDFQALFVLELSERLANFLNVAVLTPHQGLELKERQSSLRVHHFKYFWPARWQKLFGNEGRGRGALSNLEENKLLYFQIPFFLAALFLNLRKMVKTKDIGIIHAHWIIPQGLMCVLYKKIFRQKNLKIVGTVHGDIFGLPMLNFLRRWTINNVDYLTVVSHDIKKRVEKLKVKTKVNVIPMGTNDQLFNPDRYDEGVKLRHRISGPFLLFVGRLIELKGVKNLLSAMPEVIKSYPDTKLLIVGSGPREYDLKKQAKDLDIENNTIFIRAISRKELPKYYATADIFIGPSITTKEGKSEAFGLVFVEAMLSKTAVITSDLVTISDIIKNDATGIQCNVRDTQEFSNKILSLIQDKKKRDYLAENGYNHAKNNFTWDVIANKYRNVFNVYLKE